MQPVWSVTKMIANVYCMICYCELHPNIYQQYGKMMILNMHLNAIMIIINNTSLLYKSIFSCITTYSRNRMHTLCSAIMYNKDENGKQF